MRKLAAVIAVVAVTLVGCADSRGDTQDPTPAPVGETVDGRDGVEFVDVPHSIEGSAFPNLLRWCEGDTLYVVSEQYDRTGGGIAIGVGGCEDGYILGSE